MSFKNSIITLLAGAAIWIVYDLYWLFNRFSVLWIYYKSKPVDNILALIRILPAIAVLVFAITLLNGNADEIFDEEEVI